MEKQQVKLTDDKVLEIDPITKGDMEQFFERFRETYTEESLVELGKRITTVEDAEIMANHHYTKGKRLWLEVDVEDINASGGLISWLYSQSKTNKGTSGLRLFGCRLNSIYFEKPSDFTDDERTAIIHLYNKVIGDQQK